MFCGEDQRQKRAQWKNEIVEKEGATKSLLHPRDTGNVLWDALLEA